MKTIFLFLGAACLAAAPLHAQRGGPQRDTGGRDAGSGVVPAGRVGSTPVQPSHGIAANRGGHDSNFRGHGAFRGDRDSWHHRGGRYFYLSGVPYFYPYYGYGFGYPAYYGGFGPSYYDDPYYDGYYGPGPEEAYRPYEGRIVTETAPGAARVRSLPTVVQRQLAELGFYHGSIDGQFGPASRAALRRFQHARGLRETGTIDEASLGALGFKTHG